MTRPADLLWPARIAAGNERRCVEQPIGCGGPATEFRDALSAREYEISRLCQTCQDSVFGGDGEDE